MLRYLAQWIFNINIGSHTCYVLLIIFFSFPTLYFFSSSILKNLLNFIHKKFLTKAEINKIVTFVFCLYIYIV